MTVLFVIFGILLIVSGVSLMTTPLFTFLNAGYFIVILIGVYGIMGIVKSIVKKKFGLNFIFSIISILFSGCVMFFPHMMLLTDSIMIYMTAAWFVLQGIINVITSIRITKPLGTGLWILQLIFGILGILIGCYSFFHPLAMAVSMGVLIGIYFIETGMSMIVTASVADDLRRP